MLDFYSKKNIISYFKKQKSNIKKSLGQNFLIEKSICEKIVELIKTENNILEIGAGLGNLTKQILRKKIKKLVIVEKDNNFLEVLEKLKQTSKQKLSIIIEDAIKLSKENINKYDYIVGNLPYNVSTKLILDLIENNFCGTLVFTLQSEVAKRIVSQHSCKNYGYLSVVCQSFFECQNCFYISSENFFPKPKVASCVVLMKYKSYVKNIKIYTSLKKILHLAFSQRRKNIANSLKSLLPNIKILLDKVEIPYHYRAENISVKKYILIAETLTNEVKK